jgi:FO synthase
VIIQNFRAKPGTRMARAPEPPLEDHLWTIAVARLILGPEMNIQAPPNLRPGTLAPLLGAGINDWGGVSPVTPDHVNPEAPWPQLDALARETEAAGGVLTERLAIYPSYVQQPARWLDAAFHKAILRATDATGHAQSESWRAGAAETPSEADLAFIGRAPQPRSGSGRSRSALAPILERAGETLSEAEIVALFAARGADFAAVCAAADRLRSETCGETVTYVVNRNVNYTNVCTYRCGFCAFSKGRTHQHLRGRPYDLGFEEIERRAREAWARGATEICLQGGIHPDYTGATYLEICRRVKAAAPDLHVHGFSPLEVRQGARTLGLPIAAFLSQLREAGLTSLPGTAAEVLDDEVRAIICPDKLSTAEWLGVMGTAHALGLRSTATIMFGHVDRPVHWARHLLRLRDLQARTGGFTEFVPLPFVHMEAPIYLKGRARQGPSFREAVLMHAVARLALHPVIANIQTSWVKMGPAGARACLRAGANDLGGTLMNETITRSAGAVHGQEMAPRRMEALIRALGREPRQRSTLYGPVPPERRAAAFDAAPLDAVQTAPPARKPPRPARPSTDRGVTRPSASG